MRTWEDAASALRFRLCPFVQCPDDVFRVLGDINKLNSTGSKNLRENRKVGDAPLVPILIITMKKPKQMTQSHS